MRPRKSHFALAGLLVVGLAATAVSSQPPSAPPPGTAPRGGGGGGPVAELRKQIAGKEKQPAETVFKNIQSLKGVPAEELLSIMDNGFRPALGVKCSFCHDPQNWASDDKDEKKVARQMMQMNHDINEKYLKTMKGLDSEKPMVSCATCHRGEQKPALSMEKKGDKAPAEKH
ncbi:MAG TPA: c-type cytochrome [Thermoanaerobaculia bacterium]|nr:c-type cytochrome [Thermoanaerobaculia bacterium]